MIILFKSRASFPDISAPSRLPCSFVLFILNFNSAVGTCVVVIETLAPKFSCEILLLLLRGSSHMYMLVDDCYSHIPTLCSILSTAGRLHIRSRTNGLFQPQIHMFIEVLCVLVSKKIKFSTYSQPWFVGLAQSPSKRCWTGFSTSKSREF